MGYEKCNKTEFLILIFLVRLFYDPSWIPTGIPLTKTAVTVTQANDDDGTFQASGANRCHIGTVQLIRWHRNTTFIGYSVYNVLISQLKLEQHVS